MSVYINFPSGRTGPGVLESQQYTQDFSATVLMETPSLLHIISPMSATNDRDIYISDSLSIPLTSEFKHSRLSNHQLLHNTERTNPLRWLQQIKTVSLPTFIQSLHTFLFTGFKSLFYTLISYSEIIEVVNMSPALENPWPDDKVFVKYVLKSPENIQQTIPRLKPLVFV